MTHSNMPEPINCGFSANAFTEKKTPKDFKVYYGSWEEDIALRKYTMTATILYDNVLSNLL